MVKADVKTRLQGAKAILESVRRIITSLNQELTEKISLAGIEEQHRIIDIEIAKLA